MTGRRLYDHYCDVTNHCPHTYGLSRLAYDGNEPVAWPFLSVRDKRVWNELARRVASKPRKAKA